MLILHLKITNELIATIFLLQCNSPKIFKNIKKTILKCEWL